MLISGNEDCSRHDSAYCDRSWCEGSGRLLHTTDGTGRLDRRSYRLDNPGAARLWDYAIVRITIDIPDEAYSLAKSIARDQNRSLGRVVGDLILQPANGATGSSIGMSDYGFPAFRCTRPVTTDEVNALDDDA